VRSSMVRPGASPGFAAAKPEGRLRVEALTRDGRRPRLDCWTDSKNLRCRWVLRAMMTSICQVVEPYLDS